MAEQIVGYAEPEDHDPGCGFKATLLPGRNVARGLDPEHCARCRDLMRLLEVAQAARRARVLGGRDV